LPDLSTQKDEMKPSQEAEKPENKIIGIKRALNFDESLSI
jgi:hypothetical protein